MRKKVGIIKRMLFLCLVFLLSINSFAAIVSDNDGAAFITKAEFDALKNDFQSQIDSYNNSIDNKIDGAIASYLAGIKLSNTETKSFAVGGGEKCLVFNSDTVTDLAWGKAELEFMCSSAAINSNAASPASYMRFIMKRSGTSTDYGYEVFEIDDSDKFIEYNKQCKLKIKTASSVQGSGGGAAYTSVPNTSKIYYRWHASDDEQPTLSRTGGLASKYSDRVWDIGWLASYGSGTNFGVWNQNDTYHTMSAEWEKKSDSNVLWCFDAGINEDTIWSKSFNTDAGLQQVVGNACTNYASATTTHPISYTTPDLAGVTTEVKAYAVGAQNADNRWSWSSLEWWTTGKYNNYSDPTVTSWPFYELQLENMKKKGANIVNKNFTSTILGAFSPFGFTGKITEGIPIDVFDKVGTIDFTIDTTSLGQNAIIAFDTAPIVITSAKRLDDWTANANFDLKVDNVAKTTSAANISAGVHKITLQLKDVDTTNKKMILFKVSFPKTVTSSTRKVFNLPATYDFTKMD